MNKIEDIVIRGRHIPVNQDIFNFDDLISEVDIKTTCFTIRLLSNSFSYIPYQDLFIRSIPDDFKSFIGSEFISHKIKHINIDSYPRADLMLLKLVTDRGIVTFIVGVRELYSD